MDDVASRPGTRISAAEIERRHAALRQADASNRIENEFRSLESAPIFEAFIHGEIEMHEILPRLKALHRHP